MDSGTACGLPLLTGRQLLKVALPIRATIPAILTRRQYGQRILSARSGSSLPATIRPMLRPVMTTAAGDSRSTPPGRGSQPGDGSIRLVSRAHSFVAGSIAMMVGLDHMRGSYEVYVNGTRIGDRRYQQPLYQYQRALMVYAVPQPLLAARGDMVLAIRWCSTTPAPNADRTLGGRLFDQ